MRQHLTLITATTLIVVMLLAAVNTEPRNPIMDVRAEYAGRFHSGGYEIDWIAPHNLRELTKFSTAIVYGEVLRGVESPPKEAGALPWGVYEVTVYIYLKKPVAFDCNRILVSMVTEEDQVALLQPGDRCVFFLYLSPELGFSRDSVFRICGGYTRYVVYKTQVYRADSLSPRYPANATRGEKLSSFLLRVEEYAGSS